MEIHRRQHEGHLELLFEGRLDGYWAQHLTESAGDVMREGTHAVRLNLSKATYISSAGIGALVDIYKQFAAVNGSFVVVEPSRQVKHVLDMVGLGGMLSGAESPPMTAATATPAVVRKESGGAVFEIHSLHEEAALTCRILGNPERLAGAQFSEEDHHSVAIANDRLALGLGAFGENFPVCQDRFGEFLAVSGAATCQPTDGTNYPDYMMSSGGYIPRLSALYGLCCDGGWAKLIRFEGAGPVPLSAIVETCLEAVGGGAAGIAMLAESAGLMGAALKRSPVGGAKSIYGFPEIRTWLSFSPERSYAHALALVAGVAASSPDALLRPLVRPIRRGSPVSGHFHAAAFGYRPLQKGVLDLQNTVRGLFEAGGLQGVLHILADDRESAQGGESELQRGACWVSPIGNFRNWEEER